MNSLQCQLYPGSPSFAANLVYSHWQYLYQKKNKPRHGFLIRSTNGFRSFSFFPSVLLLDDYSSIRWSEPVVYSLIYVALIGSVAAYACYHTPLNIPDDHRFALRFINPFCGRTWVIDFERKLNSQILIAIGIIVLGISGQQRISIENDWHSRNPGKKFLLRKFLTN